MPFFFSGGQEQNITFEVQGGILFVEKTSLKKSEKTLRHLRKKISFLSKTPATFAKNCCLTKSDIF